jgi:hypothetical protein
MPLVPERQTGEETWKPPKKVILFRKSGSIGHRGTFTLLHSLVKNSHKVTKLRYVSTSFFHTGYPICHDNYSLKKQASLPETFIFRGKNYGNVSMCFPPNLTWTATYYSFLMRGETADVYSGCWTRTGQRLMNTKNGGMITDREKSKYSYKTLTPEVPQGLTSHRNRLLAWTSRQLATWTVVQSLPVPHNIKKTANVCIT